MTLLKICKITGCDANTILDIVQILKIKENHTTPIGCVAFFKIDTCIILRYVNFKNTLIFESKINFNTFDTL